MKNNLSWLLGMWKKFQSRILYLNDLSSRLILFLNPSSRSTSQRVHLVQILTWTTVFCFVFFVFFWKIFLKRSFRSQQNWREGPEISHVAFFHTCIASPSINIPHQRGTSVTIYEPALTHFFKKIWFDWFI